LKWRQASGRIGSFGGAGLLDAQAKIKSSEMAKDRIFILN